MRVDTHLCAHCGQAMTRRANERPSAFSRRLFCSVQCIGQSQAAGRAERFWNKVDRRGPDKCWPWLGRCSDRGYGQYATSEKNYRAHRLALELSGTPVPQDRLIMHSCDNPPCCNPAHLSVGTYLDNNRDMVAKGRDRRLSGPDNPNTKLTEADKAAIVLRRGEPLGLIAADYAVAKSTICRVQKAALCG